MHPSHRPARPTPVAWHSRQWSTSIALRTNRSLSRARTRSCLETDWLLKRRMGRLSTKRREYNRPQIYRHENSQQRDSPETTPKGAASEAARRRSQSRGKGRQNARSKARSSKARHWTCPKKEDHHNEGQKDRGRRNPEKENNEEDRSRDARRAVRRVAAPTQSESPEWRFHSGLLFRWLLTAFFDDDFRFTNLWRRIRKLSRMAHRSG